MLGIERKTFRGAVSALSHHLLSPIFYCDGLEGGERGERLVAFEGLSLSPSTHVGHLQVHSALFQFCGYTQVWTCAGTGIFTLTGAWQWWCAPLIPALGRRRRWISVNSRPAQSMEQVQDSQGYIERHCLDKNQKMLTEILLQALKKE